MNWNKKTNNFIRLNEKETKFNRLNRSFILGDLNRLKQDKVGVYTDYHVSDQWKNENK